MATKLNSFAVVHSVRATVIQTRRWKRDYDTLSHAAALSKFRHCILVFAHRIQACGLRAKVGGCHRLRRRVNELRITHAEKQSAESCRWHHHFVYCSRWHDYFSVGSENNKLRGGDTNACCVGGDVRRVRNSNCCLSLDQQAGMSVVPPVSAAGSSGRSSRGR